MDCVVTISFHHKLAIGLEILLFVVFILRGNISLSIFSVMFGTAIATTTSTSWFKLEIQQMIQALFFASSIENRTNFKLIFIFYLRSTSCCSELLGIIFWGKILLSLLMGKLMLFLVIIGSIFVLPSIFSRLGIGLSLEVVILASTGMTSITS